jgi:hypothetical protein
MAKFERWGFFRRGLYQFVETMRMSVTWVIKMSLVALISLLPLGEGLGMRVYGAPIFVNQFARDEFAMRIHLSLFLRLVWLGAKPSPNSLPVGEGLVEHQTPG